MSLSFDQLRKANLERTADVFHPLDAWSPTDWACVMAGECGEACNQVKKLRRLDGADGVIDSPEERARLTRNVADELADAIIYADLLAARLGIELGDAVRCKFNEVSERRGSFVKLRKE